ncbi:MAG: hypothetical protein U0324_29675 [Polyangiales bacterium]
MTVALPQDASTSPEAAFDLSRPSPLPPPARADADLRDEVLDAERAVARADLAGPAEARVAARVALAELWLARHAVGPALEALRAAEKLSPGAPAVAEASARALPHVSLLREAALARRAIARQRPSPDACHAAACAWLRTDDLAEATQALDELARVAPDDPRTAQLTVTFARLRSSAQGGGGLVATLLECAVRARRLDDRERWREHALDAWFESRGADGGELLAEALAAAGRPRAAVYVAAEAAARALEAAPADLAAAARVLVRCARLAETAGLPGEATAAWMVRALLPDDRARDARESLRDLLAERGLAVDLAARLRADARRAAPPARAAAWKGVAATEIGANPVMAAFALAESLRHQPDDAEALDLLASFADDPALAPAVRDALWVLARAPSPERAPRTRALLWLATLEEAAGDLASAEAALAAIDEPVPEVFEAIARVHEGADAQATRVHAVLEAIDAAAADDRDTLYEHLLADFAEAPGALRDARLNARVLGPRAARDERAATLWVRAARRSDDPSQLPATLRRLATRAEEPAIRVRAALAAAEELDQAGETAEAAELLALVLDELPGDASLAAALAALAEHSEDPGLAVDALRAVARAASDPWERDFLLRFTGAHEGIFAAFASCLSTPAPTAQRCADLARLHDLVGDATSILAARTRALMAQGGPVAQALEVSERFAAFAPHSPEATIAWFGAANVAGDREQIASSSVAVARSLAGARDVSAVTRSALARLESFNAPDAARAVALEAAAAVGLSDRPLRAAVLEAVRRNPDAPEAAPLLEHIAASAGAIEEHVPALQLLADGYARTGDVALEIAALWRLRPHARDRATARLAQLLPRAGDRARYARLLTEQLASAATADERRARLLAIAAEYAAADPPRPDDAVECVDRVAQEGGGAEAQGLVVRAFLALGQPEAAHGRLMRWAAESPSDADAALRMRCATRIAREVMRAPARALATLRTLLRRTPGDHAALAQAEEIALEASSLDVMFAIYNDLTAAAAGEHARHAIAYRRATLLERAGRAGDALVEQFALFVKSPALGASFSAVERLAERSGRWDVLVRALGLLALQATTPETRGRYYAAASDVARERCQDPRLALLLEVAAWQAAHDPAVEAALRRRVRAMRALDPAVARVAAELMIDDALAAAAQTWDDNARRGHALKALELCAAETDDGRRAAEAAELYLRQHDDPAAGRRAVTELVEPASVGASVRRAALAAASAVTSDLPPRPSRDADGFSALDLDDLSSPADFPPAPPPVEPPPAPPVEPTAVLLEALPEAPPAAGTEVLPAALPDVLEASPEADHEPLAAPSARLELPPPAPPAGLAAEPLPPPIEAPPASLPDVPAAEPSLLAEHAPLTERPSERPRGPRTSLKPPRAPFNPKAAMQAGYPVRTATPLYTPTPQRPSQRPSQRPPSSVPRPPGSWRPPPPKAPSVPPPPEVVAPPPEAPPSLPEVPSPPAPTPSTPDVELELGDETAELALPPELMDDGDVEDLAPADITFEAPAPPEPAPEAVEAPTPSLPTPSLPAPSLHAPSVDDLRAAAEAGDDEAAAVLAAELARAPETRDEALMLQRRRFDADPTRLDALEGLADIYASLRMRHESAALASVHAVLSGRSLTHWPEAPALAELADPLDGVAKVLMPAHHGPFAELGALVWEALLGARSAAARAAFAQERTAASVQNEFGRTFAAAVRLLQLPKSTAYTLRADLPDGMDIATATTPPTVLVAASLARDTARARFWLGRTLESTRVGHLPITAGLEDGEHLVGAVRAAFGRSTPGRLDASVSRIAARLYEGIPPRALRRLQDLVEQLGPRLTWPAWQGAVAAARDHAAMLVCGDFRAAAEALLEEAPPDVPRDASAAVASWEPLRDLARFAVSEEYLLLRWQRLRVDRW